MIEWFNNLSNAEKIACATLAVTIIGGLFGLVKWWFGKKDKSAQQKKSINQEGSKNKAALFNGSGNTANFAERDIHTGIDPKDILDRDEKAFIQLGQSKVSRKR